MKPGSKRLILIVNCCALMLWANFLCSTERVAFITSATGDGNIGSWSDAGGNTGLAAADAVCLARATAAGLANPGDFVAWLSDSGTDAYCRIHGLTGTRAGNCGQASLPVFAGPWVRVDGAPFAPRIDLALGNHGIIYYPVMRDELNSTAWNAFYFTATANDGTYIGSASNGCTDWTSNAFESVVMGVSSGGTSAWTSGSNTICSSVIHLLCMQTGGGDPLPPFWRQGARMFVTSSSGTGNLNTWPEAVALTGLEAGNAICKARASAEGLGDPDSFRAWLSTSTEDAMDQLSWAGPWTRSDGILIANSMSGLTDGQLLACPNIDDQGTYLGNIGVWTGTQASGIAAPDTCSNWTVEATGTDAEGGVTHKSSSFWTAFTSSSCNSNFHLYCFSNSITDLFFDGFESADSTAWSSTAP